MPVAFCLSPGTNRITTGTGGLGFGCVIAFHDMCYGILDIDY